MPGPARTIHDMPAYQRTYRTARRQRLHSARLCRDCDATHPADTQTQINQHKLPHGQETSRRH